MRCGYCNLKMKEYDIYDRDTGEVTGSHHVCPNQWKEGHP